MNNEVFQTDHEQLASGRFVLIRGVKRALNGEGFLVFPAGGGKGERVKGMPKEKWIHYFTIFDRCNKFGMPHGSGWALELPWLIDFLAYMKSVYRMIENHIEVKAMQGGNVELGEVGF